MGFILRLPSSSLIPCLNPGSRGRSLCQGKKSRAESLVFVPQQHRVEAFLARPWLCSVLFQQQREAGPWLASLLLGSPVQLHPHPRGRAFTGMCELENGARTRNTRE